MFFFSAENVLQVLPLAHEYQSSLVTDCENFMIKMCNPDEGLTVSTLLDYILAGEKYELTRFIATAVEFCAKVDFDVLNGKTFTCTYAVGNDDKDISSKFSKIGLKTQFAISKKRLQRIEIVCRKYSSLVADDYKIALS